MDNKKEKELRMLATEGTQLSDRGYNIVIGLTVLWGILLNVLMAYFLTPYIVKINIWVMTIGYFVVSIACMTLIFKSHKPAFSFLGFTGLAAVMGVLLSSYMVYFTGETIYSAFLATGIVVVSMLIISTLFPAFFIGIGRVLMFALLGSIVVELIGGLLLHIPMGIMDYVVVVIFAGYIGFDWAKAQAYPKTLDNAIDSAADIYVDIINIFIRILSIMGKKSD